MTTVLFFACVFALWLLMALAAGIRRRRLRPGEPGLRGRQEPRAAVVSPYLWFALGVVVGAVGMFWIVSDLVEAGLAAEEESE